MAKCGWSSTGSGNCVCFLELLDGLVRAEVRWDESASLDAVKSVPWEGREAVRSEPNHGKPYWATVNGQPVVDGHNPQPAHWSSVLEAQEAVASRLRPLFAVASLALTNRSQDQAFQTIRK